MRPSIRAMITLAVPCVANAFMWATLYLWPRLGFRDDLTAVFVTGWISGVVCAIAGLVVFFLSFKSPLGWGLFGFFCTTMILNVLGFFFALGMGVNAWS